MHNIKQHIVFKSIAMLLMLAMLFPTALKLSHTFNHHTHEVCDGFSDTHFHSLDLECEFYKFKIQKDFIFDVAVHSEFESTAIIHFQSVLYFFSYNHQHLSFSLRAPPVLV